MKTQQSIAIHGTEILSMEGLGVFSNVLAMRQGKCQASLGFGGEISRRNGPVPYYSLPEDLTVYHEIPKRILGMDRTTQFGFLVCQSLLEKWHVMRNQTCPEKCGIWHGTSRGPVQKQIEADVSHKKNRVKPSLAVDVPLSATSGALSGFLGVQGPNITLSATCCSGGYALSEACYSLLSGRCDLALVIASEASVHPLVLSQMQSAGMLTRETQSADLGCIPFCANRTGTALGEGAAAMILSSEAFSKEKGCEPIGYIHGWDTATDSHSRTLSDHEGKSLSHSIRRSLAMAGISAEEIKKISPHGTGTIYNDAVALLALEKVFSGISPEIIPTKHYTGHCLGATSLMEVAVLLEMLNTNTSLELDYLKDSIFGKKISGNKGNPHEDIIEGDFKGRLIGLSQSLGFWGNIFSVVIEGQSIDK